MTFCLQFSTLFGGSLQTGKETKQCRLVFRPLAWETCTEIKILVLIYCTNLEAAVYINAPSVLQLLPAPQLLLAYTLSPGHPGAVGCEGGSPCSCSLSLHCQSRLHSPRAMCPYTHTQNPTYPQAIPTHNPPHPLATPRGAAAAGARQKSRGRTPVKPTGDEACHQGPVWGSSCLSRLPVWQPRSTDLKKISGVNYSEERQVLKYHIENNF